MGSTPCNKFGSEEDADKIEDSRRYYEGDRNKMKAELSKDQGEIFEMITSSVVVTQLGLTVDPSFTPPGKNEHGIDLFCRNGDKIAIVESKADQRGLGALGTTSDGHQQNSMDWIYDKAQEMIDSGIPGNVELGREILDIPRDQAENLIERYVVSGRWEGKGDSTDFVINIYEGTGDSWDRLGSFSGIDIGIPILDSD